MKQTNVFFSIIIPLYNKIRYVKETIRSVQKQTYGNYELLIIDDGSTDGSYELVLNLSKQDDKINLFRQNNSGVSIARNNGIKKAKGEYVCFLDADDLWHEDYLETINKAIALYPNTPLLCSGYDVISNNIAKVEKQVNLKKIIQEEICNIDFFEFSCKAKMCIALTSSVCINRQILLDRNILFPIGIKMGEDIDVWVRTSLQEKIVYINKELMTYREFAEGSLTSGHGHAEETYHFWAWFKLPSISPYKNKFTNRMIYTVAIHAIKNGDMKNGIKWMSKCRGTYLVSHRIAYIIKAILHL